jgi:hypothetical protein
MPVSVGAPFSSRAKSGENGRFEFQARRDEADSGAKRQRPTFQVVAAAKGYGPACVDADGSAASYDLTLRLAKDDIPLEGRILTLEGKALAGVRVSVVEIRAKPGEDLAAYIRAARRAGGEGPLNEGETLLRLQGQPLTEPTSAVTDAAGRFRLTGLGRERVIQLMIRGAGIQDARMIVLTGNIKAEDLPPPLGPARFYAARFEHRAAPGRSITGIVRDKATGKPLAGMWVTGAGSLSPVQTDKDGRYELTGCAKAKEHYVESDQAGGTYFRGVVAVADTAGLGPINAPDLELTRGIPFHGKVVDKVTGRPVHANVLYMALWPNKEAIKMVGAFRYSGFSQAQTNADGTFHCVVAPGPGAVAVAGPAGQYMDACVDPQEHFAKSLGAAARATGNRNHLMRVGAVTYAPQPQYTPQDDFQAIVLIDPAKDTKEIRNKVELQPARKLKGTVTDPDGKPLAGARVQGLKQATNLDTLTGADFTMPAPNPLRPRTLVVYHEGRGLAGSLQVKGDDPGPLNVRLQRWGAITGRLVDPEGQPIAGAVVYADGKGHLGHVSPRGRTDKDGKFRIDRLIPGATYATHFHVVQSRSPKPGTTFGLIAKELTVNAGEERQLGNVKGSAN